MDCVIGCDVGSQGVKAVLLSILPLYRSAYFALLPVFAQAARLPAP